MENRAPIFMEGFLLQARNTHLFIPIFLVVVAYTTVSTLGYSTVIKPLRTEVFQYVEDLWFSGPNDHVWPGYADLVAETRIRACHLVAASTAYLLITAFTVGPAILAVTVSGAVTACSGEQRSSTFHALVRKFLAGVMMKGPFGTALLGHVLHAVACRGAISIFGFYIALFLRYTTSHVVLSMEFLLFLLGHLFAVYMELVSTLAVVVSAAEPAGCFYGVRALRQSWWILAGKTTPAVILVFVKAAVTAVVETISLSIWVYVYPIRYYNTMTGAYAILSGFVYSSLYAALQLWFVCATTLYYYQCRQRNDGYSSI